MTNKQIIQWAREADPDLNSRTLFEVAQLRPGAMRRFAELAYAAGVAATREECAKVCQGVVDGGMYDGWQQYAAAACRDAIRAMNIGVAA